MTSRARLTNEAGDPFTKADLERTVGDAATIVNSALGPAMMSQELSLALAPVAFDLVLQTLLDFEVD